MSPNNYKRILGNNVAHINSESGLFSRYLYIIYNNTMYFIQVSPWSRYRTNSLLGVSKNFKKKDKVRLCKTNFLFTIKPLHFNFKQNL